MHRIEMLSNKELKTPMAHFKRLKFTHGAVPYEIALRLDEHTCVRCDSIVDLVPYDASYLVDCDIKQRGKTTRITVTESNTILPVCSSCSEEFEAWDRSTTLKNLKYSGLEICTFMLSLIFLLFWFAYGVPFLILSIFSAGATPIFYAKHQIDRRKVQITGTDPEENVLVHGDDGVILVKPNNISDWMSLDEWAFYSSDLRKSTEEKEMIEAQVPEEELHFNRILSSARNLLYSAHFHEALETVNEALEIKSHDFDAIMLKKTILKKFGIYE